MSHQVHPRRSSCKPPTVCLRKVLLVAAALAVLLFFIYPSTHNQQVEAKKLKEKKALKSLVKGLIFKNLSTKKNFLPLPIPIPVPIELTDPPVFIKGKPKYITVYKPRPPMPIISSSYHYMLQPYPDSYDSHMMYPSYSPSYRGSKHSSSDDSSINFTDFDDEFGSYYIREKSNRKSKPYSRMFDRIDSEEGLKSRISLEELESVDHDDKKTLYRQKRQVYQSSYEDEPPCFGFPLEINIKSRIKMDQMFPIQGKSQFKKCIKLEFPKLQPQEPSY